MRSISTSRIFQVRYLYTQFRSNRKFPPAALDALLTSNYFILTLWRRCQYQRQSSISAGSGLDNHNIKPPISCVAGYLTLQLIASLRSVDGLFNFRAREVGLVRIKHLAPSRTDRSCFTESAKSGNQETLKKRFSLTGKTHITP